MMVIKLQWDFDQLGKWAEEWQLEINSDECEVVFYNVKPRQDLQSDGRALENAEEVSSNITALFHNSRVFFLRMACAA